MAWDLTVDSKISRTFSFLSLLASRVFGAYSAIAKVDAVNRHIFQIIIEKKEEYENTIPPLGEAIPLTAPLLITLATSSHDLNVHRNRREPHGPVVNYNEITSPKEPTLLCWPYYA